MKFQLTGYSEDGHLCRIADILANDEIEAERQFRFNRPEISGVKVEVTAVPQVKVEANASAQVTRAPEIMLSTPVFSIAISQADLPREGVLASQTQLKRTQFPATRRIPQWAEIPASAAESQFDGGRIYRLLVQGHAGSNFPVEPRTRFTGRVDVCVHCRSSYLAVLLTLHITSACDGWKKIGKYSVAITGIFDSTPEAHWEKD